MPTVPATYGHVNVKAPGVYVTASAAIVDNGAAVAAEVGAAGVGVAGLVVKQKRNSIDDGRAALLNIAVGEKYYLRTDGEIRVKTPEGLTPTKFMPLYVDPSDNSIESAASATNVALGLVTELPNDGRGLPAGFMTVNCDYRSYCPAFVAP